MDKTDPGKFLGIYLNDHLAGATAGVELIDRLTGSERGAAAAELHALSAEIHSDRDQLIELMKRLGIGVDRAKQALAWCGEKVSPLKLNGRLTRKSPLSSLVELEMMALGVRGKSLGWKTLRLRAATDPRIDAESVDELLRRAESQLERLETLRKRAAEEATGVRRS